MTWVADQIGMQDVGRAQVEAYLKSIYGDGFKPPEQPRIVSGGSVDTGQHISIPPEPVPVPNVTVKQRWRRPKITGLGPWLFASVALVVIAVLGWSWLNRPAPSPDSSAKAPFKPGEGKAGLDLQVIPPDPPLMQ